MRRDELRGDNASDGCVGVDAGEGVGVFEWGRGRRGRDEDAVVGIPELGFAGGVAGADGGVAERVSGGRWGWGKGAEEVEESREEDGGL